MADVAEVKVGPKAPDHQEVLTSLGMTEEEYAQVMSEHGDWHVATEDAWVKAHDALRYDMEDLRKALEAIIDRLKAGEALQPWVVNNLQKWWPWFEKIVHHHHDNEEAIAFPDICKRINFPAKLTDDHKPLMTELAAVGASVKALKVGQPADNLADVSAILTQFQAMQSHMCEHLLEEEALGLPLLRKAFTRKEWVPTENRIVAGLKPIDLGWMMRPLPLEARKTWMTKVARIPGLVQKFILLPQVGKFQKKIGNLLVECQQGHQMPTRSFFCFAA